MLITFSGLDGSGKSTLTSWLRVQLERQRRRVTVTHFNDRIGVYAALRVLRDWVWRRPQTHGAPRLERRTDGLGRIRDGVLWSKAVRQVVYPVDLLIFMGYRAIVEKLGGRVLIMDRYFYDRLVDVTDRPPNRWLRLLARLAPTPDLPVLLVIDPEVAFARKGEYTVGYLRHRDEMYRRVFPLVRAGVWLPAQELEAAKRLLALAMDERLR